MVITALVLSIIALAVSTMTALQMIFGKPKVVLEPQYENDKLLFFAENKPISCKILDILGVTRREVKSFTATFTIIRRDSNEIIVLDYYLAIDLKGWSYQTRNTLPSGISARMPIVRCNRNGEVTIINYVNSPILPAGGYKVIMNVNVDSKIMHKDKLFIIAKTEPYLSWGRY